MELCTSERGQNGVLHLLGECKGMQGVQGAAWMC